MKQKKLFPLLVFLVLWAAMEAAIALSVWIARPASVPVTRGAVVPEGSDLIVNPAAIDAYVVENLSRTGLPGAMLAITRGGRVLYTAGYGHSSDGSSVTPDTPMPIASMTKSFTAAAVLLLVEEGRLRLDDPVQAHVPEFTLADPRGKDITLRQLLNHTSGLTARGLPPNPSTLPATYAERVDWLRTSRLASDPGAVFQYCNENYNLLARVIERASNQSYAQFLETRVFEPLGMTRTRAYLTLGEPMPGVAPGHTLLYGVPVAHRPPNELGGAGGGMVSSANDLARWLVLHASNGRSEQGRTLLSPESMATMHRASAAGSNYGFGWREEPLRDGTKSIHHSGKLQVFSAHQRVFPDTGYAYAFVINGGHAFSAEAASFIWGLNALVTGHEPVIGPPVILFGLPFSLLADNVVAIFTMLVVTFGVVAIARARQWAERQAGEPRWRTALRLVPHGLLLAGPLLLPLVMGTMNRGVAPPLATIFAVWPPLVFFVVAVAIVGLAVLVARLVCLSSMRAGEMSATV